MSQIVDNSPEMALDDPRIVDLLNKSSEPEPPAEKTDVKESKEPASSADSKPEDKSTESDDPSQLKAQIRGLKAELSRRQGNSEKVEQLEAQIAELTTKMNATKEVKKDFDWIQQLDDDALASKQTDWDDELADARARYAQAEQAGDERGMERQGQRILTAKKVVAAFRKETLDRVERNRKASDKAQAEATTIKSELDDMFEAVSEQFPEFQDKDSELWKAGDAEFRSHPELMKRLGPAGEVVAAAMAIVRNPHLVGKKSESGARRDVLQSLEGTVKKALKTGSSAPTTQRSTTYDISTGDGLANFNKMIDRIKGG